jgi:hypothetical protein
MTATRAEMTPQRYDRLQAAVGDSATRFAAAAASAGCVASVAQRGPLPMAHGRAEIEATVEAAAIAFQEAAA